MVFVRLSGCNLQCPFCDTDHRASREMTADEIVAEVWRTDKEANAQNPVWNSCGRVCITGGEPLLQLDEALVNALHEYGYKVHVETNGTRPVPPGVDWVTLSPKEDVPDLKGNGTVVLKEAQELKLVYDGSMDAGRLYHWEAFPATWHFLQPCDTGNPEKNQALIRQTVDYILGHGGIWRLSLQTHKFLHIR